MHGQPPGKQPHPDDPAFEALTAAAAAPGGVESDGAEAAPQQQLGHPGGGGDTGQPVGSGLRSVYGQPPGKQPDQIEKIKQVYQISASVQAEEDDLAEEQPQVPRAPAPAGLGPAQQPPWRQHPQQQHPQQQHPHHLPAARGAQPTSPQQHVAAAAGPPQAYVPAPAASSHQARQRPAPPAPGGAGGGGGAAADKPTSRKRPASQAAGEGAQRKKAANGSAAAAAGGQAAPGASSLQRLPTGMSSSRPFSSSMPRSGSMGGEGASQQIRTMPGAPRSLQQRQQLVNGATGGARPAGASRPKQTAGAAAKPKQQAKTPSSGQRRPSSAAGGGGAAAAAAQQYRPGDVVWAKIGVYPWWPAQLQRPTADEHFKPKHAVSDLFCVFYGRWLGGCVCGWLGGWVVECLGGWVHWQVAGCVHAWVVAGHAGESDWAARPLVRGALPAASAQMSPGYCDSRQDGAGEANWLVLQQHMQARCNELSMWRAGKPVNHISDRH